MQQQIESKIKQLYEQVLLESNFQRSEYLPQELHSLCKRITALTQTLTLIVLQSGKHVPSITQKQFNRLTMFACNQ